MNRKKQALVALASLVVVGVVGAVLAVDDQKAKESTEKSVPYDVRIAAERIRACGEQNRCGTLEQDVPLVLDWSKSLPEVKAKCGPNRAHSEWLAGYCDGSLESPTGAQGLLDRALLVEMLAQEKPKAIQYEDGSSVLRWSDGTEVRTPALDDLIAECEMGNSPEEERLCLDALPRSGQPEEPAEIAQRETPEESACKDVATEGDESLVEAKFAECERLYGR